MSKIQPKLVSQNVIDTILNQSVRPPMLPNVQNLINPDNVKTFVEKYWIILLILLGIIGYFVYIKYFQKTETFEEPKKKKKSKKKVKIVEHINSCSSCQKSGAKSCPSCAQRIDGKMSEMETPIRDLQEPQIVETYSHSHPKEQYHQDYVNQEPQYPQETTYHNQVYGQSITDDAQGVSGFGGIESFNGGNFGNYVSF